MVDNVKEYHANLLDQRSETQSIITAALDVVKQFIIERRRIMVGGMMIDMALKLKGDEIYGPDVLPDYDFYSPNHFRDAYDLGEVLCKKEFKHISVIPARHITTMKVRINFEVVADITYCPQKIYDILPTLTYNKFIIRHPHVQMIDQHLALSNPFANPGQEVIFERWKKDCIRYDALYKHYPIPAPKPSELPSKKYAFHTVKINKDLLKGNVIGGWAAFQIYSDTDISGTIATSVTLPKWAPVTILTQDIKKYSNYCEDGGTCYSQYFDHIPKRAEFSLGGVQYEMLDTAGMQISAIGGLCGLQYVMVYILSQMIYNSDNENINIYARHCYNECRSMIERAYDMPKDRGSLYLPMVSVYGDSNISPSVVVYKETFMARLNKQPLPTVSPKSAFPDYPQCMIDAKFDITKSKYFQIGGEKITDL